MTPSLKDLDDQVIVITGATSGIGLATALAAAERGAKVVLAARNRAALQDVVDQIRDAGGTATYAVADVARREDLEQLAITAIRAYGGFDTWVNNAGVSIFGQMEDIPDADSRRLFDVNFWGVVYGTRIAAAHLRRKGGAIINLGSVVSDVGFPVQGMYGASKHAIKGFTDAFRMEMQAAGRPISVTLIKPASIDTPFPSHAKNYLGTEPKLPPPVYAPEEVARAILHAAVHGGRDYYVGGGGKLMSTLNKHLPSLVDWLGSRTIPAQSASNDPPARPRAGTLHQAGRDGAVRGDSPHHVMTSLYTRASTNPALSGVLLAAAGLAATAWLSRSRAGARP